MRIDALNTSVRPITYEPPVRTDAVRGVDDKDPATEQQKKTEEDRAARETEASAVNSSVYGDVLAKDDDGDTVAAKQQALEALEDGLVFKKEQAEEVTTSLRKDEQTTAEQTAQASEQKSAAEKLAEEEAKKEQQDDQQQSLTGVSAQQLETMYLQGKISRYQYDQEIGRRDALMEKEEKTVGQMEEEEDKEKENPASAEKIQKEIENNNGFSERMTKLATATAEEEIRGDAILKAGENDRVDLMNQVFGTN
ncbi:MAG: hypothetical protein K6E16_03315 [Lachnospiraceae bacterium]|nr:hypothetical protein [Lachnospiraceae bacterium]